MREELLFYFIEDTKDIEDREGIVMASTYNINANLKLNLTANNIKPVITSLQNQLKAHPLNLSIKLDFIGLSLQEIKAQNKNILLLSQSLDILAKSSLRASYGLKNLQASLGGVAGALGGFNAGVSSFNRVNQQVSAVRQNVQGTTKALKEGSKEAITFAETIGKSFRFLSSYALAGTVLYSVVDALSVGTKAVLEFDRELVRLKQVGGDTENTIAGIAKEVTKLSTSLGASSSDLIKAATTFRQAGLSATETKDALAVLAKTTLSPTFEDIKATTEGIIATLSQFKKGTKALEEQFGAISKVSADYAVESTDLVEAIKRVGGAFASTGGNLQELLGLYTSIRATTRESAESIATGLRTTIARLQDPVIAKKLEEYGVQVYDSEKRFVGVYKAVEQLHRALTNLPAGDMRIAEILKDIGGLRNLSRVTPLLYEFPLAQQAYGSALKGQNVLNKDAAIAQEAMLVQLSKMKEAFLDLFRVIGTDSSVKNFVSLLTGALQGLANVLKEIKPLIPLVLGIGVVSLGGLIKNSYTGIMKGFNNGYKARTFSTGGYVDGSDSVPALRSGTDSVPALLSPGEYVLSTADIKAMGGMERIKELRHNASRNLPITQPGVQEQFQIRGPYWNKERAIEKHGLEHAYYQEAPRQLFNNARYVELTKSLGPVYGSAAFFHELSSRHNNPLKKPNINYFIKKALAVRAGYDPTRMKDETLNNLIQRIKSRLVKRAGGGVIPNGPRLNEDTFKRLQNIFNAVGLKVPVDSIIKGIYRSNSELPDWLKDLVNKDLGDSSKFSFFHPPSKSIKVNKENPIWYLLHETGHAIHRSVDETKALEIANDFGKLRKSLSSRHYTDINHRIYKHLAKTNPGVIDRENFADSITYYIKNHKNKKDPLVKKIKELINSTPYGMSTSLPPRVRKIPQSSGKPSGRSAAHLEKLKPPTQGSVPPIIPPVIPPVSAPGEFPNPPRKHDLGPQYPKGYNFSNTGMTGIPIDPNDLPKPIKAGPIPQQPGIDLDEITKRQFTGKARRQPYKSVDLPDISGLSTPNLTKGGVRKYFPPIKPQVSKKVFRKLNPYNLETDYSLIDRSQLYPNRNIYYKSPNTNPQYNSAYARKQFGGGMHDLYKKISKAENKKYQRGSGAPPFGTRAWAFGGLSPEPVNNWQGRAGSYAGLAGGSLPGDIPFMGGGYGVGGNIPPPTNNSSSSGYGGRSGGGSGPNFPGFPGFPGGPGGPGGPFMGAGYAIPGPKKFWTRGRIAAAAIGGGIAAHYAIPYIGDQLSGATKEKPSAFSAVGTGLAEGALGGGFIGAEIGSRIPGIGGAKGAVFGALIGGLGGAVTSLKSFNEELHNIHLKEFDQRLQNVIVNVKTGTLASPNYKSYLETTIDESITKNSSKVSSPNDSYLESRINKSIDKAKSGTGIQALQALPEEEKKRLSEFASNTLKQLVEANPKKDVAQIVKDFGPVSVKGQNVGLGNLLALDKQVSEATNNEIALKRATNELQNKLNASIAAATKEYTVSAAALENFSNKIEFASTEFNRRSQYSAIGSDAMYGKISGGPNDITVGSLGGHRSFERNVDEFSRTGGGYDQSRQALMEIIEDVASNPNDSAETYFTNIKNRFIQSGAGGSYNNQIAELASGMVTPNLHEKVKREGAAGITDEILSRYRPIKQMGEASNKALQQVFAQQQQQRAQQYDRQFDIIRQGGAIRQFRGDTFAQSAERSFAQGEGLFTDSRRTGYRYGRRGEYSTRGRPRISLGVTNGVTNEELAIIGGGAIRNQAFQQSQEMLTGIRGGGTVDQIQTEIRNEQAKITQLNLEREKARFPNVAKANEIEKAGQEKITKSQSIINILEGSLKTAAPGSKGEIVERIQKEQQNIENTKRNVANQLNATYKSSSAENINRLAAASDKSANRVRFLTTSLENLAARTDRVTQAEKLYAITSNKKAQDLESRKRDADVFAFGSMEEKQALMQREMITQQALNLDAGQFSTLPDEIKKIVFERLQESAGQVRTIQTYDKYGREKDLRNISGEEALRIFRQPFIRRTIGGNELGRAERLAHQEVLNARNEQEKNLKAANTEKSTQLIKDMADSQKNFQSFLTQFNKSMADQLRASEVYLRNSAELATQLKAFPRQVDIQLKREGKVEVILNGGQLINAMKGDVEAYVWERIAQYVDIEIQKLKKDNVLN